MYSYVVVTWSLFAASAAIAQPARQMMFVYKFSEYAWRHFDGEPRLMTVKRNEEYVFTFPLPSVKEKVTIGSYKNVSNQYGNEVQVSGGEQRFTLTENNLTDNAFVVSIFPDKNFVGAVKALMTLHSIRYGVEQLKGTCR